MQVKNDDDELSVGIIAGIAVGSVVGVIIIAAVIYVIVRKRSGRAKVAHAEGGEHK